MDPEEARRQAREQGIDEWTRLGWLAPHDELDRRHRRAYFPWPRRGRHDRARAWSLLRRISKRRVS